MAKFNNSPEAIDSSLLLWSGIKPTNTSVKEIYDVLVFPSNSIEQGAGSSIIFNIPPQNTGLLIDCEIITNFRVTKSTGQDLDANQQVSVVNNIGSAMFQQVELKVDSRTSFLQQMNHSYDLCTFFETMLNNEKDREGILFAREMFITDSGTKAQSEEAYFFKTEDDKNVANHGGAARAKRIAGSRDVTVVTKLNVPLLKQHKAIVPSTYMTVTLVKSRDSYCILAAADSHTKLHINEIKLKCTYVRPEDSLLMLINSKLEVTPVTYEVDRLSIIARILPPGLRNHTINNLFDHGALPKFMLLAVTTPEAINGHYERNPYTFLNISRVQLYVNNQAYFPEPLSNEGEDVKQLMIDNLYKTTQRDHTGSMLITYENIDLYQFATFCLTDDRTYGPHLSLKKNSDTRLEIDLGTESLDNRILLAYCVHDQQISIDRERTITITE